MLIFTSDDTMQENGLKLCQGKLILAMMKKLFTERVVKL